jgi:general nucleoside transport system ATP-binding protein
VLTATGIIKRYGSGTALDGVDFVARPGEIHALIGENGAGKSTLVNILAGRTAADAGRVALDGAVLRDRSSATTLKRCVAAVFQTPMLFERLSWEENLALGVSRRGVWLVLNDAKARAAEHARELDFTLPPPGARVADCSIVTQVRLEILRALGSNPRVLILDEPTGVLPPAELAAFLAMIRRLRTVGRIVVLVTHKLAEALAVADRITVLRAGRKITEISASEVDERELARLMIGELPPARLDRGEPPRPGEAGALKLENVVCETQGRRMIDNLSLQVAPGEIVGIAGVDGNGQAELAAVLAGVVPLSAGRVRIAAGSAVAVIPQNRDREALILEMPLWENLLLAPPLRRRLSRRSGMLQRGLALKLCTELLAGYTIRAPGALATAASLSGGNRQRLTVARAFSSAPAVIVAHDICRGLDLRAAAETHQRLLNYAATGGAVLLISSDLDEIFALSDRVFVINRGRLSEVGASDRNPVRVGLLMSGATA